MAAITALSGPERRPPLRGHFGYRALRAAIVLGGIALFSFVLMQFECLPHGLHGVDAGVLIRGVRENLMQGSWELHCLRVATACMQLSLVTMYLTHFFTQPFWSTVDCVLFFGAIFAFAFAILCRVIPRSRRPRP
jgi:hypothetical protein